MSESDDKKTPQPSSPEGPPVKTLLDAPTEASGPDVAKAVATAGIKESPENAPPPGLAVLTSSVPEASSYGEEGPSAKVPSRVTAVPPVPGVSSAAWPAPNTVKAAREATISQGMWPGGAPTLTAQVSEGLTTGGEKPGAPAASTLTPAALEVSQAALPPRSPLGALVGATTSPAAQRLFVPTVSGEPPRQPPPEPRVFTGDGFLPGLDPAWPLVLLPVRIETRFRERENQLLVRVYPDEIFADAHERELTQDERDAAVSYWGHATEDEERDAWESLVKRYAAPRAAWIVEATRPDRPGEPVGTKRASWTRAVQARLLPEKWVVHLTPSTGSPFFHSGTRIFPELALSLRPPEPEDPVLGERDTPLRERVDQEVLWTIDFAAARTAGMAFSVPIGSVRHFTRILVFGVRNERDPRRTAAELARLFEAHRYTSGLAFVRQGTQTNNTALAAAGFTANNLDSRRSGSLPAPTARDAPLPNALALANALGVPAATFDRLEGGDLQEQRHAHSMNRALWPATLGYYLAQMIDPALPVPLWHELREHFATWVRGRGPLPCFRVGRVPYGVLPVTSLERLEPDKLSALERRFVPVLRSQLQFWRAPVEAGMVPRVGRFPGDPDRDLLELLGMDASAREVRVRYGLGPQAMLNAASLLNIPEPVIARWCLAMINRTPPIAVRGFGARLSSMVYHPDAPRTTDPLVTALPLSEDQGSAPGYLAEIRSKTLQELRGSLAAAGTNPSVPLLHRLIRHAVLLEYLRVNAELQAARETTFGGRGDGTPDNTDRQSARGRLRELEILGVPGMVSPWAIDEDPTFRGMVRLDPAQRSGPAGPPRNYAAAELGPLDDALRTLAECSSAELERLLMETLDTCSHRIDAWVTSLATKRLHAMRGSRPDGCHLGAYAWVENLRARGEEPRSDGYIHGPSLDHAAAGAVLRSAFATHDDARFAVDLSSARVRAAQSVLDEVRVGQSLGAVLGLRIERALHEERLDRYIDPLRRQFPLVANKGANSGLPADRVAARNVVDGLAFHRNYDSLRTAGIPDPIPDHQAAFGRLRDDIARTVDAVSDLLTAESVFQLVRGNTTVAGATLDSVSRGQRPPDPEVARSPRSGVALTHRVALAFSPRAIAAAATRRLPEFPSPRAYLEPTLNDWVGRMLGDPGGVACTVTWKPAPVAGEPQPPQAFEVALAELGLSPLDVLALSQERPSDWVPLPPPGAPAGTLPLPPGTEVDLRILAVVYVRLATQPGATLLGISHRPRAASRRRTFPELWEMARALNDVLQSARPMRREDLLPPDQPRETGTAPPASEDLLGRIKRTVEHCAETCEALRQVGDATSPTLIRTNLERAARLGVVGAFPAPAVFSEGTPASLRAKAHAVAQEMRLRLAKAADRESPGTISTDELQRTAVARMREHTDDVMSAIFAAPPAMLRFFSLDPGSAPAVLGALAEASTPTGADPPAVRRWFHQAARVRPALARWRKLALYAATSPGLAPPASGEPRVLPRMPSFQVAQLSGTSYRHWAALPFHEERVPGTGELRPVLPPSGTISLAVHLPDGRPDATWVAWAGLVLDEWVELIPNRREVTGVAFHYDDPGAEAAQTVLVAVPPAEDRPWDANTLVAVLGETLDMAKVRAVDGELLGPLAQFLPATYLANNTRGDTVATDFTGRLVADRPRTEGS